MGGCAVGTRGVLLHVKLFFADFLVFDSCKASGDEVTLWPRLLERSGYATSVLPEQLPFLPESLQAGVVQLNWGCDRASVRWEC